MNKRGQWVLVVILTLPYISHLFNVQKLNSILAVEHCERAVYVAAGNQQASYAFGDLVRPELAALFSGYLGTSYLRSFKRLYSHSNWINILCFPLVLPVAEQMTFHYCNVIRLYQAIDACTASKNERLREGLSKRFAEYAPSCFTNRIYHF